MRKIVYFMAAVATLLMLTGCEEKSEVNITSDLGTEASVTTAETTRRRVRTEETEESSEIIDEPMPQETVETTSHVVLCVDENQFAIIEKNDTPAMVDVFSAAPDAGLSSCEVGQFYDVVADYVYGTGGVVGIWRDIENVRNVEQLDYDDGLSRISAVSDIDGGIMLNYCGEQPICYFKNKDAEKSALVYYNKGVYNVSINGAKALQYKRMENYRGEICDYCVFYDEDSDFEEFRKNPEVGSIGKCFCIGKQPIPGVDLTGAIQYSSIQTSGYYENVDKTLMCVIRSRADLAEFYAAFGNDETMDKVKAAIPDEDEFFGEYVVFATSIEVSSSADKMEICSARVEDGRFVFEIKDKQPEIGTCDMARWFLLALYRKRLPRLSTPTALT